MNDEVIAMKFENIENNINEIKSDTKEIKQLISQLEQKFVTRTEFQYLENQVKKNTDNQNKVVWILITAIIWAVLSFIFIK